MNKLKALWRRLNWKMPTWIGLIGLVGIAATVTAQFGQLTFIPANYRGWALTLSVALIAVERFMQGIDYRTVVNGLSKHPNPSVLTSFIDHTNPNTPNITPFDVQTSASGGLLGHASIPAGTPAGEVQA